MANSPRPEMAIEIPFEADKKVDPAIAVNEVSDRHSNAPSLNATPATNTNVEKAEKQEKKRFFAKPWGRRQIGAICALVFVAFTLSALVIALPIYFTKIYGYAKDTDDYWKLPQPNEDASYHVKRNAPQFALHNFPDPGLMQHDGIWYAYGTNPKKRNPNSIHVPVATSTDFVNWTLKEDYDSLPTLGTWEGKVNHWAPDVIQRDDGKFVMYYSGQVKKNFGTHHCVGVAVSNGTNPLGPFIPENEPLACPHKHGGAIDPSPFRDPDGTLYVVYKGDGNSIGHGGNCGNSKKPVVSVPLLLQELKSDGVTTVGDAVKILDIDGSDGPLVEAPNLIVTSDGTYYLFFSSHCYTSFGYNVKYAHSKSLKGPYTRADRPLLQTSDWGLESPGGATVSTDGSKIVFHANCGTHRCMWAGAIDIRSNNQTIVMTELTAQTTTNSTGSSR
ncbi:unnamed protein product [Penicillium salamii]|uniref:Glycoside hydrolase, family 43 n=1 Tax=Penicillium salamii TaxID=1612424 RepID=A0A9W4JNL7_9EURO|nr:unnamed protein product [Penicillium salamii]CAG8050572.1 unnamed protein product [Penicillium salamii]CAG8150584.1 unnamed protein product [Penicillium salamii]CAG8207421.1 unnamed protein product [Penicillium salamii]CAG8320948.1 unnamed protein product [Penicillium salamii]